MLYDNRKISAIRRAIHADNGSADGGYLQKSHTSRTGETVRKTDVPSLSKKQPEHGSSAHRTELDFIFEEDTVMSKNVFVDGIYENVPMDTILGKLKDIPLADQEEELPGYAAMIARELYNEGKGITSTQLRRFYTYVKAIEQKNAHRKPEDGIEDKAKLRFLLPKLAGSVKRTDKSKIEPLYKVFASCLHDNRIQKVEELQLFVEFFEAILDFYETYK